MASLYQILGVKPRASLEEVRKAYRKLAREYHPDINPNPVAHERMAQINAAFEVLGDPVLRSEYDSRFGRSTLDEPGANDAVHTPEAVVATLLYRHRTHRTPVYGASFTPSKGTLVTSSFDNELVWWSPDLSGPESRLRLEGGAVNSLRAVDEDTVVAAGSSELAMSCWVVRSGRVASWRQTPRAWVTTMVPSPNGGYIAVGSVDNVLRVVTAEHGSTVFSDGAHSQSVTAVGWSADSKTVASGSADATVKLWDVRKAAPFLTLNEVRSAVTSVAFSPNGRWLAVAAVDLSVRVFDAHSGKLKQKFFGHTKPVEAMAFHPHNWLLASAGRDGTIGLWSIQTGVGHGQIMASHQPVSCVAFDPRGEYMAAGGLDKTLRIWALRLPG